MTTIDPKAGHLLPSEDLIDVDHLIRCYYDDKPDVSVVEQRVAFGTSGHRGSALHKSFNENHVLAISQAIAEYREAHNISGPLFLGIDTHALSKPAAQSAIEVLAAHGVTLMLAKDDGFTPTPAISQAIIAYNRKRSSGLADGIVVTPSHNPPEDGGFKYNPPHGGPADGNITSVIEKRANQLLLEKMQGVKRWPIERALAASTTHQYDFVSHYVAALDAVIDFEVIRNANLKLGVDPLGGASVAYWPRIAELYHLDLTVTNGAVDPTFRFMAADWDGRIRMDPSSTYAMTGLVALRERFDLAFGCDTDSDRHGIVTRSSGLMPPNHVLSVLAHQLFSQRAAWPVEAALGKTVVSSRMIDEVAKSLGRKILEVPVGFKWFVDGLAHGTIATAGEESAGATFLQRDARVWTTDKDGLIACLACAEMTARNGHDPAELYAGLEQRFGAVAFSRSDALATPDQKARIAKLTPDAVKTRELLGSPITSVIDRAPGNNAPIGGLKVIARDHWFAVRPSGTENIYKIYAESAEGEERLPALFKAAQSIVDAALAVS
jgi:phosphoglucomutase